MKILFLALAAILLFPLCSFSYDDPALDREMTAVMWGVCQCGEYEEYSGEKSCHNGTDRAKNCFNDALDRIRQSSTEGTLFYYSCQSGYREDGYKFAKFNGCFRRVCEIYEKSLRKDGYDSDAEDYKKTMQKCEQKGRRGKYLCYEHFFLKVLE